MSGGLSDKHKNNYAGKGTERHMGKGMLLTAAGRLLRGDLSERWYFIKLKWTDGNIYAALWRKKKKRMLQVRE